MKVYLVTMKGLPDHNVQERLKCIALEKAWDLRNAERIAYSPPVMEHAATQDGEGAVPLSDPRPTRQYSWLAAADDERYIKQWRDALDERKALLSRIGITIQPERGPKDEDNEYVQNRHFNTPTFACVSDQLLQILEVDDSITVRSASPIASDSHEGILSRLEAVVKKFESVDIPDPANAPSHIYNEHCEVHVPGNLLATYNESLLLEDSCTDALQDALNNGWRIIAVCPQSQRRPDYILGRYNPEIYTNGKGADRKP